MDGKEDKQHISTRDVVVGAAHGAQLANVGGKLGVTAAKSIGVIDAAVVARDLADGKDVRPLDAATAAASVTLAAGAGGPAVQAAARGVAAVGAVDAAKRTGNTAKDLIAGPPTGSRPHEVFQSARTTDEQLAAVKKHPELVNAYALEGIAEAAAKRIVPDKAREAFMERVRYNIAADLAKGVNLPAVEVRRAEQDRTRGAALER